MHNALDQHALSLEDMHPNQATPSMDSARPPALLKGVLENLCPPAGGAVLDLTLGRGGHIGVLLDLEEGPGRCLAIDCDPAARERAAERLGGDARLDILPGRYETVWKEPAFRDWCQGHAPDGFDRVFLDLGPSDLQLADPARGFSPECEGPLDMRMDPGSGPTALQWLEAQTEQALADAIFTFGEERASRPIARAVLAALQSGRLRSPRDLAAAVRSARTQRRDGEESVARTFQAVRIAVNRELAGLPRTLEAAARHLKPGGRLGVISHNALEDRLVKETLRRLAGILDAPAPAPGPRLLRLVPSGSFSSARGHVHHAFSFQDLETAPEACLRIAERI
jgi:16S rRNA (cytosine1402-N4)-methyltransferase